MKRSVNALSNIASKPFFWMKCLKGFVSKESLLEWCFPLTIGDCGFVLYTCPEFCRVWNFSTDHRVMRFRISFQSCRGRCHNVKLAIEHLPFLLWARPVPKASRYDARVMCPLEMICECTHSVAELTDNSLFSLRSLFPFCMPVSTFQSLERYNATETEILLNAKTECYV